MGQGPPRHAVIAETLRAEIRSGRLAAGAPLPSEARLAERFAVSRGTVRHALAALRAEGLIVGGRGRAPTVRRSGLAQSFDELVSFTQWARELGRVPSGRTLELARRPVDAQTADRLELAPGAPVFQYTRLRLLDGEPLMVERTTVIEPVGRLLLDCDLEHGSVVEQLGERGVVLAEAEQTVAAVAADGEDAALLEIPRRSPVLEVRRRTVDAAGVATAWARERYRGDAIEITAHGRRAVARTGVALRPVPDRRVVAAETG